MNKKWAIGGGIALLTAILGYFIFSGGGSETDLLKVIPEKASAIVKIDFAKISKMMEGSKTEDFSDLKKTLGITDGTVQALSRIVDAIAKDPKSSGINFSMPSYFFIHKTEKGNALGWVLGLSGKSKWESMVKDKSPVGTTIEKMRKIDFAEMETGSYFSWNDNVLLYTYQPSESREYFVELLETRNYEPRGESLVANVSKLKSEFGGAMNCRWMATKFFNGLLGRVFLDELPKDMAVLFNSKSSEGTMSIESEFINTNKEIMEKIAVIKSSTQGQEAMREIPQKLDCYFALNFGLDSKKLEELKIGNIDELMELNSKKESEELRNSFTGDLTLFGFENTALEDSKDTVASKRRFIKSFKETIENIILVQGLSKDFTPYEKALSKISTIDGNIYQLPYRVAFVTIKGGKTYFSNDKNSITSIANNNTPYKLSNTTLLNLMGKGNFLYFNPQKMFRMLAKDRSLSNSTREKAKLLENRSKFIVTGSGKDKKTILEINYENKKENGLKQLIFSIQSFVELALIFNEESSYRNNSSYDFNEINSIDTESLE